MNASMTLLDTTVPVESATVQTKITEIVMILTNALSIMADVQINVLITQVDIFVCVRIGGKKNLAPMGKVANLFVTVVSFIMVMLAGEFMESLIIGMLLMLVKSWVLS